MSDPFVGQLLLVPYTFAPRNWAFCQGQLMSISQNTALFSLLGTNFGGDGRSTFGLPNLQGSAATGTGTGPGFSDISLGQVSGTPTVSLLYSNMPAHTHAQQAAATAATVGIPAKAVFAPTPGAKGHPGTPYYQVAPVPANYAQLAPTTLAPIGGSQPHNNMMPYLVMNWIIALTGIFPARQ